MNSAARDPAALASLYLKGGKGFLVTLACYLDASGVTGDSAHVVMAGFAAPADPWKAFESDWQELLKAPRYAPFLEVRNGLRYAHARKMRSWKKEIREAFYAESNYLLRHHEISFAVASTFKLSDYKDVYKNFPLSVKDGIYGFAFRAAMVATCKNVSKKYGGQPVAFFLEAGDAGQGGAKMIYEFHKLATEMGLPEGKLFQVDSYSVLPKEKWGALQVSDMHAYALQKHLGSHLAKNTGKGNTDPYFGDINILLSDVMHLHFVIQKEQIQKQR